MGTHYTLPAASGDPNQRPPEPEGVADIDEDHLEMHDLFAAFSAASHATRPRLLDRLTGMICLHFDREERMMRRAAYPGLERHRQAHSFLLAQLNRFAALAENCPNDVSEDQLMTFVESWIDDHFASEDRMFCDFLRNH